MTDLRHIANTRFISLILILVLLLSACNLPVAKSATADPKAVQTAAAGTVEAIGLQATVKAQEAQLTAIAETKVAPPPVPTDTPPQGQQGQPEPTATEGQPPPLPPTFTPTPTNTEQPPTPGLPTITASIDTNCRTGPSSAYPRVGYLLVGQVSTVHGRNDAGNWWYIENPKSPGTYCWVWGETTTVVGDISQLVVITPPPLPAASFTASFANMHDCGGVATLAFYVKNNGGLALASSSITIKDLSTNTFISGPEASNSPYVVSAGSCGSGHSPLNPNESAYVLKGLGFTLAHGTKTRALITLCTEPNQSGDCMEVKVNFDFP